MRALIRAVNYGVERVRTSNQEILDRLEHVEKLLDDDIAATLTGRRRRALNPSFFPGPSSMTERRIALHRMKSKESDCERCG